jgi:murein DD-endopeptidase MepM/ murein hydrolase activator NlpD
MKTCICIVVLLITHLTTHCQPPITVTAEKGNGFVTLYAENRTICPLSVTFTFETENMHYTYTPNSYLVVPANAKRYQLITLYRSTNAAYRYSFKYRWNYGDAGNKSVDTSFVYELPYAIDSAYAVSQGYFGSFSHQNTRALDFLMPEGTPVYAARAGRVASVIQHNWQSCKEPECKEFNNIVVVYHNDGTVAEYLHLQQNSATGAGNCTKL